MVEKCTMAQLGITALNKGFDCVLDSNPPPMKSAAAALNLNTFKPESPKPGANFMHNFDGMSPT